MGAFYIGGDSCWVDTVGFVIARFLQNLLQIFDEVSLNGCEAWLVEAVVHFYREHGLLSLVVEHTVGVFLVNQLTGARFEDIGDC